MAPTNPTTKMKTTTTTTMTMKKRAVRIRSTWRIRDAQLLDHDEGVEETREDEEEEEETRVEDEELDEFLLLKIDYDDNDD